MGSLIAPVTVAATDAGRPLSANFARTSFWSWFAAEIAPAGSAGLDDDRLIARLETQLKQVHPDLGFELWEPDDGTVHFVISADGLTGLFPDVVDLVRAAPSMDGWQVTAFRPRRSVGAKIRALGTELSGDQIWYHFDTDEGGLRLSLFIDGHEDQDWEMLCAASGVLLDMALGEYDAATRIARLEYCPLAPELVTLGLRPLRELAEHLDAHFANALH